MRVTDEALAAILDAFEADGECKVPMGTIFDLASDLREARALEVCDRCKVACCDVAQRDGERCCVGCVDEERMVLREELAELRHAAQALAAVTGEIDDGGAFVPCPQSSLTGTERAEIAPWLEEPWRVLRDRAGVEP